MNHIFAIAIALLLFSGCSISEKNDEKYQTPIQSPIKETSAVVDNNDPLTARDPKEQKQLNEPPTKKKLNGLQLDPYEGDRNSLRSVSFYRNDTLTWQGFPAAGRDFIIPIKEFHINEDSTYVKAPYINGNTWYEGSFRLVPDTLYKGRKMPCEYGIHKVYHLNGKLKALIDFTKDSITEYDSNGVLKYEAHFKQYKVHQKAMLRSNRN